MTNKEQIALLKQGVPAWNSWRKGNSEIIPDIYFADLEGIDLKGADLRRADLRGANLRGANLSEVDLCEANLCNDDFERLNEVCLFGANISGADLRNADLGGADLQNTDLSRSDLSNASLGGANLRGSNLGEINLTKANLVHTTLTGANLSKANLTNACLSRANLSGVNLSEAILNLANFSEANLNRSDLKRVDLHGLNFCKANLSGADLSGTNLSGADLSGANLSGADLSGANLSGADLSEVDLSGVDLSKANLNGVDLSGLNLSGVNLSGTVLCNANLKGANLSSANLEGANLQKAVISEAIFCGANLNNADLSEAYLNNTNFAGFELNGIFKADVKGSDLTTTQAIAANFNHAILTGACLEDWNINSSTNFNGVNCEYVYLRQNKQERRPSSGNFAPGEFTKLFQKSLETVDLIFRNGIDWDAFANSFKKVEVENQGAQLDVQSIEKKGDGILVVRVTVAPNADKAKIYGDFMQGYEFAHKALEAQYQARLEDKDKEINRLFYLLDKANEQLGEVPKLLVENPRKVSNYYQQNSQFAGGVVDAETVQSQQIGGDIYLKDNQELLD